MFVCNNEKELLLWIKKKQRLVAQDPDTAETELVLWIRDRLQRIRPTPAATIVAPWDSLISAALNTVNYGELAKWLMENVKCDSSAAKA